MSSKRLHLQFLLIGLAFAVLCAIPDVIPGNIQIVIQTTIFALSCYVFYRLYHAKLIFSALWVFTIVCAYDPALWLYLKQTTPFWIDMTSAFILFFVALSL